MLHLSSTEWPTGYVDPFQRPHLPGGVAPLRHDLALACYLEKRTAYAPSTVRRLDIWSTIDLRETMKRGALGDFRGLRLLASAWANKLMG